MAVPLEKAIPETGGCSTLLEEHDIVEVLPFADGG